jgi:putative DNA primase/helicase
MNDAIGQFKSAIAAAGLVPPAVIEPGCWCKFPGYQKSSKNRAAWSFMFEDMRGGVFGDFSSNMEGSWQAHNSKPYTEVELKANRERIAAMQAQREAELVQRQHHAAQQAGQRVKAAAVCTEHPYLTRKGIKRHGVRIEGDKLLIPMVDTTGAVCSVQTITPDGSKLFAPGGRVKGCYFAIGKPKGVLIVCEGFATGASLHECTDHAVAVAFNAGNLESVARALRTKYPELKIIIAADDDHLTPGNPGMTQARAAALAVGGYLATPEFFGHDRGDKDTDFNDLHQLAGLDAVKACIDRAELVTSQSGAAKDTGGDDRWPEPTPLPDALPSVDPFDAEFLPVALRPWVMDIAYRMQCPADFPAVAALVALSSLIGARAVIQPKAKDDWQVVPNLWGAVVGRPGVKKSPALGEALKPLNRLQAAELELWKSVHEAWELDCKVTAMQDDANEKKAKGLASKDPAAARQLLSPLGTPAEPTARRYIVNDATVEKLGELMQQNEWGILSYRDELYGLLTGLDKQGQEGSRAFYLQSYDGNQGYTFDRIGRGTVHIPRLCLAMIGGIQPGRIQEYVRGAVAGGSADDGLLQRFGLTVWPDVTGDFVHVDQWPDTPAKQTAWAVFDRLAQLQPASETDPVIWRFSDEAQALFVEWLVPFETEIRGDDLHPAMVSHLSKYRKLIPALALVFALIDTPDSGCVIHEDELVRAFSWGDYLRSHANRLYAAAVVPETSAASALLVKIKSGKLADTDGVIQDSFTPRQVAMKHWAGLVTAGEVRKAADLLVDFDYLRRDLVQSSDPMGRGRPSDRYLINPAVFKGGVK